MTDQWIFDSERLREILDDVPDLCFCGCHFSSLMHFVSCCHRCKGCGHRIKSSRVEAHDKSCPGMLAIRERDELRGMLDGLRGV